MTRGRRRHVRRNPRARRLVQVAAPLITVSVVAVGVATTTSISAGPLQEVSGNSVALGSAPAEVLADRAAPNISRGLTRMAISGVPAITGKRWTTAALDLRSRPTDKARSLGELPELKKVAVTGEHKAGFVQIVVKGRSRWVSADYLVAKKPTDPAHLPLVDRPCAGTSSVERGLTASAVRVYRAVCNNFPEITRYGGRSAHGEHSSGRAIDIMTSDVTIGGDIADFLRANAGPLNLFDVIWHQHIWTPVRSGEGWRSMSNRGSATANHFDHVHVSVN